MKKSKTRVFYWRILVAVAICVAAIPLTSQLTEEQAHISPQYSPVDLRPLLNRAAVRPAAAASPHDENQSYRFTDEDYNLLYHQTGLGKSGIDEVLRSSDRVSYGRKVILDLQEDFFTEPRSICIRDNWFSQREQTTDENGDVICATELVGVEEGDIIITKSSHVFGWRNGHAALVIDAKNRETLEAIVIGEDTGLRRFKKWEKYPNYVVLRLAGADREERKQIAKWAEKNLMEIPYQLTAGFFGGKDEIVDSLAAGARTDSTGGFGSDAQEPEPVKGTQCAHLIWRAYAQFGYDLDENGGWVITPKQLTKSSLLEVVQVYGMDPDNLWP